MSRRSLLFLVVSLTANLVLALAWWQRSRGGPDSGAEAGVGGSEPAIMAQRPLSDWHSLVDGATDEEFVARLRREGVPPRVIRAWIKERLWKDYAERCKTFGLDPPPVPYWLGENPVDDAEIQRRVRRSVLAQETTEKLRKLLGADLYCLPGDDAYDKREQLYGDLSLERITGLEAINDDYEALVYLVGTTSYGTPYSEIRTQLKFLEEQRRADIARLLTPSELEQYEWRSSTTAKDLQSDLGYFNATEAEYIAMYEVRRAFDERYGTERSTREERERRYAAYRELGTAYEAVLGSQRFADFQLMSDYRLGELKGWVESNGLPRERALEITRILRGADERFNALRESRDLEYKHRSAELGTLLAETAQRIGGVVGEDKLDDFMNEAGHLLPEPDPSEFQTGP